MTKSTSVGVRYINRIGELLNSVNDFLIANNLHGFNLDCISGVISNFECAILWELHRGCILEDADGYHPTEFLLQSFIQITDTNEMYLLPDEGLRFYFTGLLEITFYRAELMQEVA